MVAASEIKWLPPIFENIPVLLRTHDRWLLWAVNGEGRKVPRAAARPNINIDPHNANHWCSLDKIINAKNPLNGPGFALGSVENGPTISGVDLDNCRNPVTGEIEAWAREIIDTFDSYTEISPSGTGVKIFVIGALRDEDTSQRKVYKLEVYDRKRFFAVTGHHLKGTPTTVEPREAQLRALYARQQSTDLIELTKLFGLHLRDRGDWVDITCPWSDEHSQRDSVRDAGLHLDGDGHVDGFSCFHASHAETKKLPDVLKRFAIKSVRSEFVVNDKGVVIPNQANIKHALTKLELTLSYDMFSLRSLVTHAGRTQTLEDEHIRRFWLEIETLFGFRAGKDYFWDVVQDIAAQKKVHPVREYLKGLTWDNTPRLDRWLITYGKACDTPLTRTLGSIVLIAAVRRVRKPGCKFDEMLVLITPKQGTNKSSAIQALCPDPTWFSDDLPLYVDAKQIIERTGGKWIIEAGELNGFGKRDIEHLKSMLSRQKDGPVRLAYGRIPSEVYRQFVLIGTTNANQFLKDTTGNRRFWPVAVEAFDVNALTTDRDQLWAEAAHREAQKESIRLDPKLWGKAARQQDNRQHDDPWEAILDDAFNTKPPPHLFEVMKAMDRFTLDLPWAVLQIPAERQSDPYRDRINAIMQRLGFVKKQMKGLVGEDKKKSAKRWCRIADATFDTEAIEDDDDDPEPGSAG